MIQKIIKTLLQAVFIFFFAILFMEGLIYIFSSKEKAIQRATAQLKRECKRYDIKCSEMKGPVIERKTWNSYQLRWSNSGTGDEVHILISYLPVTSEGWYLPHVKKPANLTPSLRP